MTTAARVKGEWSLSHIIPIGFFQLVVATRKIKGSPAEYVVGLGVHTGF